MKMKKSKKELFMISILLLQNSPFGKLLKKNQ